MARKGDHRLAVTIASVFEEAVDERPAHCALICGEHSISYAELDRRANQLAHHLMSLGCSRGSLVALLLERSIDTFVALLAICKAGAAFLPLGADNPHERVAHILGDASAQILISRRRLCKGLSGSCSLLDLSNVGSRLLTRPTERPFVEVQPEDLAYCIYTSGSTGVPKGVMVTHDGIAGLCAAQRSMFGMSNEDRVLQFASLGFDAFVFDALLAFGSAATLVIRGELLGEPLVREMDKHGVTIATLPPSLLARTDLTSLVCLRCVIVAGESCPPAYVDATPPGCAFYNAYGPTEATIWSTSFHVPRTGNRLAELPIGRPVGATGVLILDQNLQPVPPEVTGEIFLTGPGLARGYRNRPDLTAERFLPCPDGPPGSRMYRTGDLGRCNEAGWIEFRGRTDTQVKLHGFRVELGEIELALASLSGVNAAAVLIQGVGPAANLAAYLEGSELTTSDLPCIEAMLMQRLPHYMIPSRWAITGRLPLNSSGKVDRNVLGSVPTLLATGLQGYEEPRPGIETAIADIWRQVLKLPRIGRTDGFRTLGGSSIQGVTVSFAVGKELGKTVPAPRGDQTLAEYARAVEAGVQTSNHDGPCHPPLDPERLSFAQEQVCFMEAAGDAWRAYRCHARLDFKGLLNVRALQQALNQLVARHEILRTSFVRDQGVWRRRVAPVVRVALPCTDLSHLESDDAAASLEHFVQEELNRKFDLTIAPLVHWRLVRVQSDTHVLLQTEHHNVHDGQSFRILLRDLAELYSSSHLERPVDLPTVEAQYGDYCVYEERWTRSDGFRQSVLAWKMELDGFCPDTLPFMRERSGLARRYHGNQERCVLDAGLFDRIGEVASRIGLSRYALMLSAFGALCARLCQQNKFLVGSALANRTASEFRETVGMLVNMLPIPFNIDIASSFFDLARETGRRVDFALTHSHVPMSEVVKELGWGASLRGQPPFNLGFSFHDSLRAAPRFSGLETTLTEALANGSSKFDLSVVGVLSNDTSPDPMELLFEYDTDTFTQEVVQRMVRQFKMLLQAVVANPHSRVQDLPLLTEAERHQILVEWNDTKADFPQDKCIHQLFEEQVERSPDAVAVVLEDQHLTYAQLNAKANRLAHHLRDLGVKPDTLVAICVERSLEMVIGVMGILKAGGAYVPLDPDYPEERLAFMLQDTSAPVLLTQDQLRERVPCTAARVVCLDSEWSEIGENATSNPQTGTSPLNLAYCIYTSGSTGTPKGVLTEHSSLCTHILASIRAYDIVASDKVLQLSSFSFDTSVEQLFVALCAGASVLVRGPDIWTVSELTRQIEAHGVTVANISTAYWHEYSLHDYQKVPRGSLRLLLVGGEAALVSSLRETPLPFRHVNAYGPTEASVTSCLCELNQLEEHGGRYIPIGRPNACRHTYILDCSLALLPVGVPGELHIAGSGLARCYLNRPDLTAEKFVPNPFGEPGSRMYKTGDVARYLPGGNIEFLSRNDRQVKLRGYRIELGEIETSLRACEGVRDAIVVAHGEQNDRRLFGFLLVSQAGASTIDDARATIARSLPGHMVPAAMVAVDGWPVNSNGKVDRQQLLSLALNTATSGPAETRVARSVQTADDSEVRVILNVLRDLIPDVSLAPDDDLIASGLHSLATMRFVARCEEAFGVGLTVRDVYQLATPNAIATAVRERRTLS